jgi:alpha-L-arabinofuranosidase
VKIAEGSNKQGQSVILNVNTRKLFVKLCNASDSTKQAEIDLSRFPLKKNATRTIISGQPEDENNYEQHPVVPQQDAVKTKKKFSVELAPYSLVMYEYEM